MPEEDTTGPRTPETDSGHPVAGQHEEQPTTSDSENADDVSVDVNVPRGLEEQAQQLKRQFQSVYTKKFQETAELRRQVEEERVALERQRDQILRMQDSLTPKEGESSKKEPEEPISVPQFQNEREAWQYLNRLIDEKAETKAKAIAKREAEEQITQFRSEQKHQQRWVQGWQKAVQEDRDLEKYQQLIFNELHNTESPYAKRYSQGKITEKGAILEAGKAIRSLIDKEVESARKASQDSSRKKGERATATPSQTPPIESGGGSKPASRSEIIAQVNAELGPPHGR